MSDEQALVDKYVEALVAATQKSPALTQDELRQVALGIGLTERDLEAVAERARGHKVRGEAYLRRQCHDEAVTEMEAACRLEPLDSTRHHDLARAYAARWKATRRSADRAEAERHARFVTERDPSFGPAYDLLETLKGSPRPRSRPTLARTVVPAVALGLVIAGAGLFFVLRPKEASSVPAATQAVEVTTESLRASRSVRDEARERSLAVRLVRQEADTDLALSVQSSLARTYRSGFVYDLKATLAGQRDEITVLKLRLDVVARNGSVLATKYFDAVPDERAYIGPDDTALVAASIYADDAVVRLSDLAAANLEIERTERQTAEGREPLAQPLSLQWERGSAGRPSFQIFERSASLSGGSLWTYSFVTLVARNTGRRPIKTLQITTRWIDAEGKELDARTQFIVTGAATASLPAGCQTPFQVVAQLPPDARPDSYTVTVLAAE